MPYKPKTAEQRAYARGIKAAAGFVEIPGDHGHYDEGQRAIHMKRSL